MKYLIVGGVAGGATVAARLRRNDEKAQIILFERGEYVSYANCGLPYYIGGTIKERNKLFVQTVKGFVSRFRIDIRTRQEVTRILPDTKQVEVKNLQSGEVYTESYDKLVLSPGAEPLRPRIEGIDSPKIFTLRNVPDTDAIKGFLQQTNPKKAVVVGGGFIGLEMAENLHEAGVQVTVIEMVDQVMAPLDFSMAAMVHQHLTSKGVTLLLGDGVKKFETLAHELGNRIMRKLGFNDTQSREMPSSKAMEAIEGFTESMKSNKHVSYNVIPDFENEGKFSIVSLNRKGEYETIETGFACREEAEERKQEIAEFGEQYTESESLRNTNKFR